MYKRQEAGSKIRQVARSQYHYAEGVADAGHPFCCVNSNTLFSNRIRSYGKLAC